MIEMLAVPIIPPLAGAELFVAAVSLLSASLRFLF
jgi:hypothetical protein